LKFLKFSFDVWITEIVEVEVFFVSGFLLFRKKLKSWLGFVHVFYSLYNTEKFWNFRILHWFLTDFVNILGTNVCRWMLFCVDVNVWLVDKMTDKKRWLWKRKSSEKSSGEAESPGSVSSHSERYSDEQVWMIICVLWIFHKC
jgi:hypothetical protein